MINIPHHYDMLLKDTFKRLVNVEKFVDLFMKMDGLHLSDFREMRVMSKGDFDIPYSAVMGVGLDVYLRKLIVFKPGVWLC